MKKIILFYGLLPTLNKIKTRTKIFSNYDRKYYITNYIPDFRNNTVYIYTKNDEDFIKNKINEDVRFFDYFELIELYQRVLPVSYKYLISTSSPDMMMKIHTCQISLNEILLWYHFLNNLNLNYYDTYVFLSNSYEIRKGHLPIFDNINCYTGDIGTAGVPIMNKTYAKKLQSIIINETEKFYSNIPYYDKDSERLKYHLIEALGLEKEFYILHKKHNPGHKSNHHNNNFLYHTVYGCEEKLNELLN